MLGAICIHKDELNPNFMGKEGGGHIEPWDASNGGKCPCFHHNINALILKNIPL